MTVVTLGIAAAFFGPRFLSETVYNQEQFESLQYAEWAPDACEYGWNSDLKSTGRDHIQEVEMVDADIADLFRYPSLQVSCDGEESVTYVGFYEEGADARHDIKAFSQAERMTILDDEDTIIELLPPEHGKTADGSTWVILTIPRYSKTYDESHVGHILLVQRKNLIMAAEAYNSQPWSESDAKTLERLLIRELED